MGKLETLLFVIFVKCVFSFQWNTLDKQSSVALAGENISFPWSYSLDQGEEVHLIQYFFNVSSLIAVKTHGVLISESHFSSRITELGSAGIKLNNARKSDSGEFTIVAEGVTNAGTTFIKNQTMFVQVIENIGTFLNDIQNKLTQLQSDHQTEIVTLKTNLEFEIAQLKSHNDQLQSELSTVEMTLEAAEVKANHTETELNQIKSNADQLDIELQKVKSESVINITLLKSDFKAVESKTNLTATELDQVKSSTTQLASELETLKTNSETERDQIRSNFQSELDVLDSNLTSIVSRVSTQIGFYARYMQNTGEMTTNQTIKFVHVNFNHGKGYEHHTGIFTAPQSGLYHFSAMMGGDTLNDQVGLYITVDGQRATAYADSYSSYHYVSTSIDLTCHLDQNQEVKVHVSHNARYLSSMASFTGLMFSLD